MPRPERVGGSRREPPPPRPPRCATRGAAPCGLYPEREELSACVPAKRSVGHLSGIPAPSSQAIRGVGRTCQTLSASSISISELTPACPTEEDPKARGRRRSGKGSVGLDLLAGDGTFETLRHGDAHLAESAASARESAPLPPSAVAAPCTLPSAFQLPPAISPAESPGEDRNQPGGE